MAHPLRKHVRMEPTVASPVTVTIRGGALEDKKSAAKLKIHDAAITIGRAEGCTLRLHDKLVSAVHCELRPADKGVLVHDLGSRNGTWIDDFLLGPNQYGYLRRAATIQVGETVLQFAAAAGTERTLPGSFGALESRSMPMQLVLDQLAKLASIDMPVHVAGETGTGKGYIARSIHDQSARASKPFIIIDCAAIPSHLAEAELFGHEKGAFTGATARRISPFVDADGGTVFLDEVGDLPLEVQAKLLRVVDEQMVKPLGQNRYRKVDVRIVSGTLHDLAARVNAGQFREDLYQRLAATRVAIPPLRDRREDIELLVRRILSDFGRADAVDAIPEATLHWMRERAWEGNVRQLRQVLQTAVGLARGGRLDIKPAYGLNRGPDPIPSRAAQPTDDDVYNTLTARGTSYEAVVHEAGRILFQRMMVETHGNLVHMCRRAALSRPFLRRLLADLGLRDVPPPRGKDKAPRSRR